MRTIEWYFLRNLVSNQFIFLNIYSSHIIIKSQFKNELRNENSIKPKTKPDRFSKPVRFGLKVSEIIKASFLSIAFSDGEKLYKYE